MSSRKKTIVWHKKKGSFIPPSLISKHGMNAETDVSDRRKKFAGDLAAKIKNAVRRSKEPQA